MICCSAFVSLAAQAQAIDKTFPADIAQDSGGQVWASVGAFYSATSSPAPGSVCRWTGTEQWQKAITPPAMDGVPGVMARLPSGAVACLWDKGDAEHWLTMHRGNFSRLAAHWTGFLRSPRLFGDNSGNVWVTGLGGDIYRMPVRLGDHSPAQHVYTIADNDYYPGYQKSNDGPDQGREAGLSYHDPLFAAPDGQGRMWFWTDSLAGADNYAALRGVLRWENGRIVHYSSLAGLPDKPLTWIAPYGKTHVWAAVKNTGIYDVDAETLSGMPVPEPEPHAFQYVQTMFALGTDWYVVAGYPTNMRTGTPIGVLWRLRAGQWRKLIDGLDSQAIYQDFTRRPFLSTSEGLWVGSYGLGAWLLPAGGGPPVRLDWHYGYALSHADHLFAVLPKVGGILAFRVNNANGAIVAPMQTHLEERVRHPRASIFRTFATNRPLVQDTRGHIWNLDIPPPTAPGAAKIAATLNEWNGSVWIVHSLPAEADSNSLSSLHVDNQGRLWALPWMGQNRERPAYVFEPAAENWQSFPTYKKALLGQLDLPGFALLGMTGETPSYGSDRRVAYKDEQWHLNFFDGHIWHQWTHDDIVPKDGRFAFEPPFFSKDGQLCVNIDHDPNKPDAEQKSWAWTEAAGWHPIPYEEGPNDWIVGIRHSQIAPPPGCPTPDFLSLVRDNHGVLWMTSGHVLYSVKNGKSEPAQPADVPTPFLDGRRVTGAMTDPGGNTFLLTESGNSREYVMLPHQP